MFTNCMSFFQCTAKISKRYSDSSYSYMSQHQRDMISETNLSKLSAKKKKKKKKLFLVLKKKNFKFSFSQKMILFFRWIYESVNIKKFRSKKIISVFSINIFKQECKLLSMWKMGWSCKWCRSSNSYKTRMAKGKKKKIF